MVQQLEARDPGQLEGRISAPIFCDLRDNISAKATLLRFVAIQSSALFMKT